jgi:hypothetical protein
MWTQRNPNGAEWQGVTKELRQTGRTILANELTAVTSAGPVIGTTEHANS